MFEVGDKVLVDLNQWKMPRRGVVTQLKSTHRHYPSCYEVRFPSGSTSRLTEFEINHIDVITRLAELLRDV